jgi:hypothetical protein
MGITAPGAGPTVAANASSELSIANLTAVTHLFTNWSITDGALVSDTAYAYAVTPDAGNNLGQITTTFAANYNAGVFPSGSIQDSNDVFSMDLTLGDGSGVTGIQIRIYPNDGAGNFDLGNAFIKTWDTTNTSFPIGTDGKISLQCKRSEFSAANPPSIDLWNSIKGIVIFFYGTTNFTYTFGDMLFTGSVAALTGNYEYLQVNVYSTGKYLAQSAISALSTISPRVASVHITPYITGLDAQVNEIWIFRRNVDTQSDYYRVKVKTTPYAAFDDSVSDTDAVIGDIKANLYLSTLSVLTSGIKTIIGLYKERVLYFDDKNIYFSDRLNADSIDTRKTVVYSGNTSEVFLWALKVTNSVILVATNLEIYQLSGSFDEFADGTLDISFVPLAVKNPAVSIAATAYSSSAIYQAADGWRVFDGVNNSPLTDNLDSLFKNIPKYGYAAITDGYYGGQVFSNAVIANKKLYTTQKDTDGIYRCFIYDLTRKYWYVYGNGFYALAVREDGTIFGSGFTNSIISDIEDSANVATTLNALFTVETGNAPRNRKDSFTFKAQVNTNGINVDVYIYKDQAVYGSTPVLIGSLNSSTLTEVKIDVRASLGIAKAYQVRFVGTTAGFVLNDYSIDYELRPTQLTSLRKSPDNFGIASAKKISVLPFIVDTLGNELVFTPTIDGIAQLPQRFTTTDKKTCFYYFTESKIGVDVGGELSGNLFEFYGWLQPEVTEVLQVNRVFDSIGPVEFTRNARLLAIRFRLYPTGASIELNILTDGVVAYTKTIPTNPLEELVYEMVVPRGTNGAVFEFQLQSGSSFARLSFEYKAVVTGSQTDNRWRRA